MARKVLFASMVLFLIAVAAGLGIGIFMQPTLTGGGGKEDVSMKVESLYELFNPGADVTVEKIEEVSGVYKVLIKAVDVAGGTVYRETYVTRDGELMSESMVLVSRSIDSISRSRNFIDCLEGKGLVVFGLANDTPTTFQFNILGGTYATKLYRSCDGNQLQQCIDGGIRQVPTTVYEGKGYAGVQAIAFFENVTACKL